MGRTHMEFSMARDALWQRLQHAAKLRFDREVKRHPDLYGYRVGKRLVPDRPRRVSKQCARR